MSGQAQTAIHPRVETLALYSTGDLSLWERWSVRRHVVHCGDCEQQVTLFRSAASELKREAKAQVLTGYEAIVDWQVLEREMLGNIAVGVDAARCIDKVGRGRLVLRFGLVAAMAALFIGGWMTHIPSEDTGRLWAQLRHAFGLERPAIAGAMLNSTPDGITVRAHGSTLTILHPRSALVSMSGPSSVTASYMDEDSGQVTITNVYAQ